MNAETFLLLLVGVVVLLAIGALIYEMGRKQGAAGVLQGLVLVDHNKPTLDAIEGLVDSVPGEFVERIIQQIIAGFQAVRPLLPGENIKLIGDTLADIGRQVSDGQPNTPPADAKVDG